MRTHGRPLAGSAANATTLSSTMASGRSSSMISVSRGSTYFAPSISACQVGAMNSPICSRVDFRNTGAVSRMKSIQNWPGTSGSSGAGPRRIRRSSKPFASRLPANDSSTMNTTRWPRRRRMSPMPTQLFVGPKAPSGKNTIVRPSATSSTLALARPHARGVARSVHAAATLASRSAGAERALRSVPRASQPRTFRAPSEPSTDREPEMNTTTRRTTYDLVADFMTIDPVTIGPDARVADAERLLERYDISGLPVVDDTGTLCGVISQTDLLRGTGDTTSAIRHRFTGLRVADLMTSPAITVDLEMSLVDAARLMRDEKVHRVVAVDPRGRAVGVLSSMDFVTLYAEG